MRKKRILFCSEASFLNTGYANYSRRILEYLYKTGKYELAELAAYGERNDNKGTSLPWKYYGVQPNINFHPQASQEELDRYQNDVIGQFGQFIFEEVCLNFLPDIVFDIRDYWMCSFIQSSPFRRYYDFALMPTVDAYPQARHWIDMYKDADIVFSYSEWAGNVLRFQSNDMINYVGTASPTADDIFKPISQKEARGKLGISNDIKIIGTVMRNQRRKLFPDLFKAFNQFLKSVDDPSKYFLYCHTGFPDLGWDIPELLQEYKICSNVLFSYKCLSSGRIFADLYKGVKTVSPDTGKMSAQICGVKNGATIEDLANIYNTMDLYVQYANSEGFGIPLVEAAACGIPIAAINYSAMTSILNNIGGIKLEPKTYYKELETGCERAVPDNDYTTNEFIKFFQIEDTSNIRQKTRQNFISHYSIDISAGNLMKQFDALELKNEAYTWYSQPKIFRPAEFDESLNQMVPAKLTKWLIINVLGQPEKLNSFFEARLIRDLTYGYKSGTVGGLYLNESSAAFDGRKQMIQFSAKDAYNDMFAIRNAINHWEQRRYKKLCQK
jgi:glycosyltransferase involved in cell wall biosynthesis